ncbi:porin [Moraxella osloensis]|uniref:Porin n=1 Tax=Faucicola osloensis TaxID=34062 RepID=A0A2D2LT77_FAUOS|nr:porin [Moraxella osloensis]ATR78214.1 porin [Moraxella osloensis]
MKKIALASAIALASITAAHAAPTVYGKVFLTADYTDTNYDDNYRASVTATSAPNDESTVKLNSNASRIGFKGSEELTDTTKLIYQLEYRIYPDNDGQQFRSRDTYVGLAHNTLGTVLAGRLNTPFRQAKGNADVFHANYDTLSIYTAGPLGYVNLGEYRANNMVSYKSPTIVGMPVTFTAAVSLSENDSEGDKLLADTVYNADGTVKTAAKYTNEADKKDNGYSASLVYDQNGVYLAAGYDNNMNVEDTAWRLAGTVDMGKMNMVQGLTLGALYQNADLFNVNDDAKTWLISGKYAIANTPWTAKAQYINTDFGDNDVSQVAVGGEYAFNKATKGHIYAGQISRDNYKDDTIVGTGIEYKF